MAVLYTKMPLKYELIWILFKRCSSTFRKKAKVQIKLIIQLLQYDSIECCKSNIIAMYSSCASLLHWQSPIILICPVVCNVKNLSLLKRSTGKWYAQTAVAKVQSNF